MVSVLISILPDISLLFPTPRDTPIFLGNIRMLSHECSGRSKITSPQKKCSWAFPLSPGLTPNLHSEVKWQRKFPVHLSLRHASWIFFSYPRSALFPGWLTVRKSTLFKGNPRVPTYMAWSEDWSYGPHETIMSGNNSSILVVRVTQPGMTSWAGHLQCSKYKPNSGHCQDLLQAQHEIQACIPFCHFVISSSNDCDQLLKEHTCKNKQ